MYQLPVESLIVTLSPSRRTPTTLLSEFALLRMFREDAVTLPVFARARTGKRHKRITRINVVFHFFTLITCLSYIDTGSYYYENIKLSTQFRNLC